ncbi:hypothetical protein C8Q75DRAFT_811076 [Abortiporus biennis]|nr:hypothetical protein C8Q75DRAFT_811076 [Abortiporus biennis]
MAATLSLAKKSALANTPPSGDDAEGILSKFKELPFEMWFMITSFLPKTDHMQLASTSRTFRVYALHGLYSDRRLTVSFVGRANRLRSLSEFLNPFRNANVFKEETLRSPSYIKIIHIKRYIGCGTSLVLGTMAIFPRVSTFVLSETCLFPSLQRNIQLPPPPSPLSPPPQKPLVFTKLTTRLKKVVPRFLRRLPDTSPSPIIKAPEAQAKLKLKSLEFNNGAKLYPPYMILTGLFSILECFDEVGVLSIGGNLWSEVSLSGPSRLSPDTLAKFTVKINNVDFNSHHTDRLSFSTPILQVLHKTSISTLTSLLVYPKTIEDCTLLGDLVLRCSAQLRTLMLVVSWEMNNILSSSGKDMSIFNLCHCQRLKQLNLNIRFDHSNMSQRTGPNKTTTVTNEKLIRDSLNPLLPGLPKQVETLVIEVHTEGCYYFVILLNTYHSLCKYLQNAILSHHGSELDKIIIHSKHRWVDNNRSEMFRLERFKDEVQLAVSQGLARLRDIKTQFIFEPCIVNID